MLAMSQGRSSCSGEATPQLQATLIGRYFHLADVSYHIQYNRVFHLNVSISHVLAFLEGGLNFLFYLIPA